MEVSTPDFLLAGCQDARCPACGGRRPESLQKAAEAAKSIAATLSRQQGDQIAPGEAMTDQNAVPEPRPPPQIR